MADMNVAFRTDATSQIGTGHFMRCLTLADGLKQRGAHIRFVSRGLPEHLRDMLSAKGIEFTLLENEELELPVGELAHSHWLGASQAQDAQATIQALADISWDWLVVDHYALDAHWEKVLRASANKIMVIDDIADRQHDCDVLLDQNFYADMHTRYVEKVPTHCQQLLGPRYALLRDEFRKLRELVKPRTGNVKNILVFFGGVDADNYTGLAIEALPGLAVDIQINVVIGAQHPNRLQIEEACAQRGYVCHVQTTRIAELMANADLAIGAAGSASWERCYLGTPSILVTLAENQVGIAKGLDWIGASVYLGSKETVSPQGILNSVKKLIEAPYEVKTISEKAYELVDGKGLDRVCQMLGC